MSLARRTIQSAVWSTAANVTVNAISFVRSIFLARWLAVEVFGIYGYATAILSIVGVVLDFGMSGAFMHRSPETSDEEQTARVHFTLKLIFVIMWTGLMTAGTLLFATGALRTALLWLVVIRGASHLIQTPELILLRRVVLQRLALIRVLYTVTATGAALLLAWYDWGIWTLLAIEMITVVVRAVGLLVWRPVWRPRVAWSAPVVRYFLRFGSRGMLADGLSMTIDRVDDLWTGAFLGKVALGYYTRAYAFATYPRMAITSSIGGVINGVYAELKGDRLRLSQAFFRANALSVRISFFGAGLIALVAPEFIRIALGSKWLPMLLAFRLMLLFTILDPIKNTIASLFVAVGHPGRLVQARAVQLLVLVMGLFTLGPLLGLAGVALAVDFMLLTGIGVLLWNARAHVDFSLLRISAIPTAGLILGMGAARVAIAGFEPLGLPFSDWTTGAAKSLIFTAVYSAIHLVYERQRIQEMVLWAWSRARSPA